MAVERITNSTPAPDAKRTGMDSSDLMTFEVLRNYFRAICNEASHFIERVAYSPLLTEGHDYTLASFTKDGRMISHGDRDLAAHFSAGEWKIKAVLDVFEGDMEPGDLFMMNDPYLGGSHVCDVAFVRPVFVEGEIVAFAMAVAHWIDVGGPIPGSFNPRARDFYAEGLRVPPVRLYRNDEPVQDLFTIIKANVRAWEVTVADIAAQFGGIRLLEQRLAECWEKYGTETVDRILEEMFDYTERRFRAAVAELPPGEYECVDFGDCDVNHPDKPPIRVHGVLCISEDGQVSFDFTDSGPAPLMSWGFARVELIGAVCDGTLHCFPYLGPLNHGLVRAIEVISKEGTCVDVVKPTATTGYASGAYEKVDQLVIGCWSQALSEVNPRYITAGTMNLANLVYGGTEEKTGREFVSYTWAEGGGGARPYKDGLSFTSMLYACGAQNQPAETLERFYPILHTRVEAAQDSCGDGEFRGGFGMHRDFRVLQDMLLTNHADRAERTPMGFGGGTNGGPVTLVLNKGGDGERDLGVHALNVPLTKGDHLTFAANGGGGYGDPLERRSEAVLEDVIDGYMSADKAREVYGVIVDVVDEELLDYRIDVEGTEALRANLRRSPEAVEGYGPGEVHPYGARVSVPRGVEPRELF
jgi:N-methylhydantoinase B